MALSGGALFSLRRSTDTPAVAALEQFLNNLRGLQQLFDVPAVCDRELVLRGEMRKTMTELASALTEAAESEPILFLASMYRDAAGKAAQLAERAPSRPSGH